MRRSVIEATCWWPLIQVFLWVLAYRLHQHALMPALGVVAGRYSTIVCTWDPETLRFTYVDADSAEFVGYTPDEMYDMRVTDVGGRPAHEYHAVSDLLVRGIATSVKLTGMVRGKLAQLWTPVLTRCSLLVPDNGRAQVLSQTRVLHPFEIAAPTCVQHSIQEPLLSLCNVGVKRPDRTEGAT